MSTLKLSLFIAGAAALGYLMGSVSFAIVVSRLLEGDDVRRHGSGNAGMTNILRTYGKAPAVLTAAGDFLKAPAAIVLSRWIFSLFGVPLHFDIGYVAGLSALLGHLFPVFFRFKGGKGVLCTLGIILCINPLVFLIIAIIFIPIVFIVRIVSVASVLGAVCYPFITWAVLTYQGSPALYDTICACVLAIIILIMHRGNIGRLIKGTEPRFSRKK